MKFSSVICVLALFFTLVPLHGIAADDYAGFLTEDERNNIGVFSSASPAVVFVRNTAIYRNRFTLNVEEIPRGSGTGFIWDKDGLIVTNTHVIEGASRVTITLNDQSTWNAEVVGLAPGKDLALLRIDAPPELLTPLPLGDSSLLEVGRKVIAIGNPFGLDTTMTVGVVSALGREISSLSNRKIRDVIQTDASINPGNSGGPLLNSLGQLIGVNTQILSPSGASAGIGFAIPVNTVKRVVPQLIRYGKEVQPTIGAQFANENWSRRRGFDGLVVVSTNPGQAAARAGIIGLQQNRRGEYLLGDIIVEVEGEPIMTSDDFLNALEQHQPGDSIEIVTIRNNERMRFVVELAAPEDI